MRCKCLALAAALLLSIGGCASKPMISQWSNPDYTSVARSCHKIMVIGVMDRGAIRATSRIALWRNCAPQASMPSRAIAS